VNTTGLNLQILVNHEYKISLMTVRKEVLNILASLSDKKSSIHFIEEDLMTLPISFVLKKSSPMNKIINRKIGQLLQAGIIQKFEKERFGAMDRVGKSDHEEIAQVLTMQHLGLCFAAIMIMLALSCVVFVIECIVARIYA
jgi:hypothetical protein